MRKLFLGLFLCLSILQGAKLDFDFYQKHGEKPGHTLLVIGGIHGNEPGSYFAPMLLATSYTITKGNLWLVPNLNFDSIVAYRRGIYGDMNRKFAHIDKDDPDYASVMRVKELITDKAVDMVLNLHDGHGYYRETWESSIFNPAAWGQACIIDQHKIPDPKFGELDKIAQQVSKKLNNGHLDTDHHRFGVKNTNTKYKDEQQQLSLTYFSITHNKPAFAIETSKNIKELHLKVFYQLKAIEAYMDIVGLEYERDFELTKENVLNKISYYGKATINGNITLDLDSVKRVLHYVPLKKRGNTLQSDNPLITILPHKTLERNLFKVNIGHKTITYLYPDYFQPDRSLQTVAMEIDGVKRTLAPAENFSFQKSFKVLAPEGYRVNIIGFTKKGMNNENGVTVRAKDIADRFAMDKQEQRFRIEIYKEGKFCTMLIAKKSSGK